MSGYIHAVPEWPRFRWDREALEPRLLAVRHSQGRLLGRMEAIGFASRAEAFLGTITEDVLKSSEIEGEFLDREQVRSSVAQHLGMDIGTTATADRTVDGVVEMILDATRNYSLPLTRERLFQWHRLLFPSPTRRLDRIRVGVWRDDAAGPMQVVSGPYGRERVHFEAPAADRVEGEMAAFLDWCNGGEPLDGVMKAGIAHLWFVTVHPFDDGNGRMARAITDMLLARFEESPVRFYSMSAQIQRERSDYYHCLEETQKGDLNITGWLAWFLDCLGRSLTAAESVLDVVLGKARFWGSYAHLPFNDRQRQMLNRLLEGFEGKLTTSKWAKIAKCSQDTALRDILALVAWGVLVKDAGGGRSTSYLLKTTMLHDGN